MKIIIMMPRNKQRFILLRTEKLVNQRIKDKNAFVLLNRGPKRKDRSNIKNIC